MKLIPLSQGKFAMIDDEDLSRISEFKWYTYASSSTGSFYAVRNGPPGRNGNQSSVYMARVIMGSPAGMEVDHADHSDHNTLNNQKANLRVCTKSHNLRNRLGAAAHSKSKIRGVYFMKARGRWAASIYLSPKKRLFLGLHDRIEDAALAYAAANRKHFGEFGGGL